MKQSKTKTNKKLPKNHNQNKTKNNKKAPTINKEGGKQEERKTEQVRVLLVVVV